MYTSIFHVINWWNFRIHRVQLLLVVQTKQGVAFVYIILKERKNRLILDHWFWNTLYQERLWGCNPSSVSLFVFFCTRRYRELVRFGVSLLTEVVDIHRWSGMERYDTIRYLLRGTRFSIIIQTRMYIYVYTLPTDGRVAGVYRG